MSLRRLVQLLPSPVRLLSLAGLLILAQGCGRSGGGGRDAGAGTTGSVGAIGITGAAGAPGTAGAGGPGTAGSAAPGTGGGAGTGVVGTGGASGTGVAGTGVAGAPGGAGAGQGGAGGGTNPTDGGPDGRPSSRDAGPYYALEMNDVTILAPLPSSSATPVLLLGTDLADDGTSLVPLALFDRLVKARALGGGEPAQAILRPEARGRLHLVAVRFDLCDRQLPGECPEAEDARLRLVFQPLFTDGLAQDAGFHAFYAIRNDEIDGAVAALRDLAATVAPQPGALRVSPALSAANPGPYAKKLRAFVKRYGGETRMVRLTVNAQPEIFSQVRWELRGVEKKGDAFVDIQIAGSTAISESVFFGGSPGYDVKPATDTPPGLAGAIAQNRFDTADAATKRDYLAALVAVENPMTNTAETVACVACHVTTVVMAGRVQTSFIDPLTLPGRYTSKFDLSTAGGKSAESTAIRALGYIARLPMISQRVVNDTAQTLTEIEQRYPAP